MNNKKALLVVILSAFFALIVALLLFKNQGISENVDAEIKPIEKVEQAAEQLFEQEKMPEETSKDEASVEKVTNTIVKNRTIEQKNNDLKVKENKELVFEQLTVQEGSVVEEVEEDVGVRKIGDVIEVTRKFNSKSPTKYSFKDFGFLYDVK